jgi:BlaI family penicillinase repressor
MERGVTETELALLRILWAQGEATIRQLADRHYGKASVAQYATVQKLLDRLEAKGCVRRERKGRVRVFHALVSREDLIERQLESMVDSLCEGSMTPLLTQLVRAKRLTRADVEKLRRLLDERNAAKRN